MRDRVNEVLDRLAPWQRLGGALEVGEPYHLLTLVVMSARTRDDQVLKLAPRFFTAFPTVQQLAHADVAAIAATIDTIGMYKQKAKHLSAMARKLVTDFDGVVPCTMEALTSLPGVGRKTASVVLSAAFGVPAIAVDTHVFRVVQRLGWVKAKTPHALEMKLRAHVPEERWDEVNKVFVPFGRAVCTPAPRCWNCPLQDICTYTKKQTTPPEDAAAIRARIAAAQEAMAQLTRDAARYAKS